MSDDLFTLPPDADPQLIRAEVFISTGEFANAAACCDKVLDADPQNLHAYLLKIMAKCNVRTPEKLAFVSGMPELPEFQLARKFADAQFAAELDELVRKCEVNNAAIPIRAACVARQNTLQELLTRDIPDYLAAEVRTRLDAEQALMRSPTPEAAEREADLTAALREKIDCRTQLAELLQKLEGLQTNQSLPKNCRNIAAKRGSEIRALLADPGVDLRTLCYEWERCKVDHEELSREIKGRDIVWWIAAGVLILLVILMSVLMFIVHIYKD